MDTDVSSKSLLISSALAILSKGSIKPNLLTHHSPLIQPSLTWSKWNMGEICGLKFHSLHVHTTQKN